jgi:4-amino-4-deoxy-L-arabinose transferase-like glycosyltransferase
LKVAPRQGRFFKSEAYLGGRELLFRNGPKDGGRYTADQLLLRVHLAAMSFGLVLALLVFLAGEEMFGTMAGLLGMAVFVFDPTVVAMAPFVATDMGAACGFFAAIYTFYRFAKQMTWQRAVVCGAAVGLALTAKHSAVLLVPMFGVLVLGELAWKRASVGKLAAGLAGISVVALAVVWAVYGFRYRMVASGVMLPPLAVEMQPLSKGVQAGVTFLNRTHLLPESYLYGLVDVQRVGDATPTFFLGRVYEHGQKWYFPAILSLKWTLGMLGLVLMAVAVWVTGQVKRGRELFFLSVPVGVYLTVAILGPLNIGVRHVLPVFPFVMLIAAGGAAWLVSERKPGRKVWGWAVAGLLVWHAASSVRTFPNYVPYANEAWGGPSKTHLYFSDSATDWAQQLKHVKWWTDTHEVKECWFAYFAEPFLQAKDYGIPCKPLPTFDSAGEEDIEVPGVIHGPVLVSFGDLNGFEFGTKVRNPYQSLMGRVPDDTIANGVAVFYGDFRLPEASAIEYQVRAGKLLEKDPVGALGAARLAVTAYPRGFDANLALGDALMATGDRAGARAAYGVAMERVEEMEPEAQAQWRPVLAKKIQ